MVPAQTPWVAAALTSSIWLGNESNSCTCDEVEGPKFCTVIV